MHNININGKGYKKKRLNKSMDCVFCKIVKGEIPSKKVYEDGNVIAFLDINPLSEGHTLVIPKKHAENIFDVSEEELSKVMQVVKKISKKRLEEGAKGVNILQNNGKEAGQLVNHIHFHVVPRNGNDKLRFWP